MNPISFSLPYFVPSKALRELVCSADLVAFVADGSILPRASGVSDKPMPSNEAVRFKSPESLSIEFNLPNRYVYANSSSEQYQ